MRAICALIVSFFLCIAPVYADKKTELEEKRAVIVEIHFKSKEGKNELLGTGIYDFKNRVFMTDLHVILDNETYQPDLVAVFASGLVCGLNVSSEWYATDRILDIALLRSPACAPRDRPRYSFGSPRDYSLGTNMTLFGFGVAGKVVPVRLSTRDSDHLRCPQCYFTSMYLGSYELFSSAQGFKGTSGGPLVHGLTIVGMMEAVSRDPPWKLYFKPIDLVLYFFELK